ncbi:hypothetical protein PAT3040_02568, partial [Paenibacillus agaridevorans]
KSAIMARIEPDLPDIAEKSAIYQAAQVCAWCAQDGEENYTAVNEQQPNQRAPSPIDEEALYHVN